MNLPNREPKQKRCLKSLKGEGCQQTKRGSSLLQRQRLSRYLKRHRAEIKAEAEKARKALRADVDKFSDEIVRKLVKV